MTRTGENISNLWDSAREEKERKKEKQNYERDINSLLQTHANIVADWGNQDCFPVVALEQQKLKQLQN